MLLPRFIGLQVLSAICAAGVLTALAPAAEQDPLSKVPPPAETVPEPGPSPLLRAVQGSDWDKVRALLAGGADPAGADENGMTPLIAAAIAGHVPTIEALIAAGAPPEVVDARVRTALGYAVALKHTAAIEALLAHQPTLPAAASGGDDLAAVALDSGDTELLDSILRRLPGGLKWTPTARIAFANALAARDTLMGPLFLAKYAGPPAENDQSQPLLAAAVVRGDLNQIGALLDFGADPDTVLDQPGDKAFRATVASDYIRYYLDSTQGITVLMLAAGLKQTECVKLLLERGAGRFTTTRGKAKLIALYFAAWSDDPETIQALIAGAPSKDAVWIEVSIDEQRARYFRDGKVVLTTEVSTGRPGFPTRPGEYVITDKNREHHSTIYHDASMPFFMRLSCRDFGLHEGVVSGHFASHGCIRLPGNIAQLLFREVPVGTWVSVRRSSKETAAADSAPRKRQ